VVERVPRETVRTAGGRYIADLPPAVADALAKQGEIELADRARSGIGAYMVVLGLVALGTPYLQDHPVVLGAFLGYFALLSIVRLVWALQVRTRYDQAPLRWRRRLRVGALVTSGSTAVLFCVTASLYGWAPTTWLLLVFITGIMAGATTTLAPDFDLARRYVVVGFVPAIGWCLLEGQAMRYTMAVAITLELVFLLVLASRQHEWYWRAACDNALLQLRTTELEDARRAAEEANAAKSVFLATISHEIRTPMNVFLGMIDIVLDTPLETAQRDDLQRARAAAVSLLAIINDVLDTSKIEAGKMTIEMGDLALRRTIDEALAVIRPTAVQKGLSLECVVARRLPEGLRGDAVRLRQILINLLGNAVKFTRAGAVTLEVRPESADGTVPDPTACVLHFSVRDTGIGVRSDKLAAIFEPFVQADVSTTRTHGGTGLGLSICQRLVELMGGRIWVESEPGRGTVFHFTARFECSPGTALPADVPVRRAAV
jgi:signal transduction histidine kinase